MLIRDWEENVFLQALALQRALQFCLDMGFWQLEVECEDITLVRCLQDDAPVYSEIGLLVEDIRELLLRFQYFSIDLIVKTCNAAARALTLSAQANEEPLNLA